MTKRKANLPLFLGIAVAIGIFIGSYFNFQNKTIFLKAKSKEAKIKRLLNYIQYDYVDEVNTDDLLDDAITQMLSKLDPHSVYIPKEELQRVTESMQGKFVGIGVQFLMYKDSVTITKILKGGPSEMAGLLAGDRILMANSDTLSGKELGSGDIMKVLKGSPDTEVNLQVYRRSVDKVLNFPLQRGDVQVTSVLGHYMINSNVGYINIEKFSRTSYIDFKKALDDLIEQGMTALVLDLRNNPGGFMDVANQIIDEFLEDGKLIVFTKNKNGAVDESYATSHGVFEQGKVYVLINENSASASEIVAGALQDNDKGIIVGRRSFGKGLVQQEMDLGDGSAIRLTTSRYYTPTGRSIQKPYTHNGDKKYYNEYLERIHNGELVSKDSIKVIDTLQYITPKGKIVYGGGGIIPDVFVPVDTASFFNRVTFERIGSFVFDYVDNRRERLNNWTLNDFAKKFDKDDVVLNRFIDAMDYNEAISPKFRSDIKHYLNALIARQLFDETGLYKMTHNRDKMIKKILELENTN